MTKWKIYSIISKKGWENIYKDISNYDCNGKLPAKKITEDDFLAYCLNDDWEDNYDI